MKEKPDMKRFLADWMPEFSKPTGIQLELMTTTSSNGTATSTGRPSATFQAVVFRNGPNRNHFRFEEKELAEFAASFKGQPFLADHGRDLTDRGGTIIASRLEQRDGSSAIVQEIRAVKPWAVEGLQDGTIDRFSIGWNAQEYICTVCNEDILGEDCKHSVFDVGSKDKKTGKTLEVLMRGLEGVETSAVVRPAVPGTGIDAIARQLSEQGLNGPSKHRAAVYSTEDEMKAKILSLLGLPGDTDEETAVNALSDRLAKPRVSTAILAALGLPQDATEDQAVIKIAGIIAPGAFVAKAEHEKVLGELVAVKVGKVIEDAIASGKLTPANEAWAREFATRDPKNFASFLAQKPIETPLGAERPDLAASAAAAASTLTEEEEFVCLRMGVTKEAYLAEKRAEAARAN